MTAVCITGATGFLGQALCRKLSNHEYPVSGAVRRLDTAFTPLADEKFYAVGSVDRTTDWYDALRGVECVIHCAGLSHVVNDTGLNSLERFRAVNVEGTRNLAQQASISGVRRLIFLSSIKAMGEKTEEGLCFGSEDLAEPEEAYGISKWEAEQALWEVVKATGLEVVIIRPPLVYGPGVKGNLRSLLDWLNKGIALPLGSVHNQRSLVGLDNLMELIMMCIDHPAAANQTFLVSDDQDLSTTELLTKLGEAAGKPARLISVPQILLKMGAKILGKQAQADRLFSNLQVDITHTKRTLGWNPSMSVEEGLRRCFEPTNDD